MTLGHEIRGHGPQRVMVLHGWFGDHHAWAPTYALLDEQAFTYACPDYRGYGASRAIEGRHTIAEIAADALALADALGWERFSLLGHSMGGMVAQEVVARRPELVSRLILCGTSPAFGKPDGDWQRRFVAERSAPLDAGRTMAELAEQLVPQMIGPGALPEGVKLATHCMAQVSPATYRRALEALVSFDRKANLPNIHVPTLLVAGEHDRNAPPAVMKKMADAIAGSSYIEMKGIGHLQNLEAPEDFDGLVLNFLALPPRLLH